MSDHNFHAIIGPNGMCECGVRNDGTVVTCGQLLEEHVRNSHVDLLAQIEKQMVCRHKNTTGGNDYHLCDDCGLMWDYRKAEPTIYNSPLIAVEAEREQEIEQLQESVRRRSKSYNELAEEVADLRSDLEAVKQERDAYSGKLHKLQVLTGQSTIGKAVLALHAENASLRSRLEAVEQERDKKTMRDASGVADSSNQPPR